MAGWGGMTELEDNSDEAAQHTARMWQFRYKGQL